MVDFKNVPLPAVLVGMHFRPPAKALLEHIPAGTVLRLAAEPENPYDEHAVQVWLLSSDIPQSQHEALAQALPATGHDLDEVLAQPEWMLGYLAATRTKALADVEFGMNTEFKPLLQAGHDTVRLGFDNAGRPRLSAILSLAHSAE